MPSAADKYSQAIELYRDTDLTLGQISDRCGVTRSGLSAYIRRAHRDLLLARHGTQGDPGGKLRGVRGQLASTHEKYRLAIEACDSEEYIDLNVSQVAAIFHLSGPALANQLRAHYPDIMPRREAERRRRGLADNNQRGPRQAAAESYAPAVELLASSDLTIEQAAERCGVSPTGLRQHILFYHQGLTRLRLARRQAAKEQPQIGALAGNGKMRDVSQDIADKYARGVELYRTTSMPATEIAREIGVNISSFRHHLRAWHPQLLAARKVGGAYLRKN